MIDCVRECRYDCPGLGSGHKWLLGPRGTGFVWVASEQLSSFWPDPNPDYSPWLMPEEPRPPIEARTRVERGTHNQAMVIALGHAVAMMSQLGMDRVEARVSHLSSILREEAANLSGVTVLTPMEPGRSAGITTLTFSGYTPERLRTLVAKLYDDYKNVVKFQWLTAPSRRDRIGMRISVAPFNPEEEIDHLLAALREELTR